jgi:nitroimidazol reductase NimA-like FMN-containing flavoprotein (pyridoxamine 5'-phosphate oxidase superfamily)
MSESHGLDQAECFRLLGTATVGRLAFTDHSLPVIHPVNFTVDGGDVMIRTSGGGKLAAAVGGAMVALEADEVDTATRSGWSVVVLGHASLVHDIDRLVALAHPDTRPWVRGRSDHVIRIKVERITGRRLCPVTTSRLPIDKILMPAPVRSSDQPIRKAKSQPKKEGQIR